MCPGNKIRRSTRFNGVHPQAFLTPNELAQDKCGAFCLAGHRAGQRQFQRDMTGFGIESRQSTNRRKDKLSEACQGAQGIPGQGEDVAVSAEGTDVTIAMTDTGFSTTTVTVPVGATVTFINNGQGCRVNQNCPSPAILCGDIDIT